MREKERVIEKERYGERGRVIDSKNDTHRDRQKEKDRNRVRERNRDIFHLH